jgi:hypothetical protein
MANQPDARPSLFRDTSLPVDQRARALMSQMTVEEKCAHLPTPLQGLSGWASSRTTGGTNACTVSAGPGWRRFFRRALLHLQQVSEGLSAAASMVGIGERDGHAGGESDAESGGDELVFRRLRVGGKKWRFRTGSAYERALVRFRG